MSPGAEFLLVTDGSDFLQFPQRTGSKVRQNAASSSIHVLVQFYLSCDRKTLHTTIGFVLQLNLWLSLWF